jgi:hypothetical protein
MAESLELFVIAIGGELHHEDDPDLVGYDFYHFINGDGEKVIPVFSTPERFREYVRENIVEGGARAHMNLMETGDERTARALAEERFTGVAMSVPKLRKHTEGVGADLIILDPRRGEPCKAWRVRE